ncbi:MAG TPA: dockerin type I domain-containing protein, partial [Phycisphaerales bacterium]|nr:dockerin type I domain-containing protein [Phycisphaerales bacterium]
QGSGVYALNSLGSAHPTALQTDMFPLHRTFSEWKNSYYSTIGVQHNGRFGGNHINNPDFIANGTAGIMKDCQDCHMPDQVGVGCVFGSPAFPVRQDVPQHSFIGSNTWVLNAIRTMDSDGNGSPDYSDGETGLSDDNVNSAITRNIDMLEKASDMTLTLIGTNSMRVRVINRGGHKLPTGFPDGRRAWLNVKYYDCFEHLIAENGHYDWGTATLTKNDTKVYEIQLGIQGAAYAASVGLPEGPTHHFLLANQVVKDNRIPSAGWFSPGSELDQTKPVGATYQSGQHWDDTNYSIPAAARHVIVTLNYQVTSKEFIEFLRDANTTDTSGQVAYDLWVEYGMSAPVVMDQEELFLPNPVDLNQDGQINIDDLTAIILQWGSSCPCSADINHDGQVNIDDLTAVILAWGSC